MDLDHWSRFAVECVFNLFLYRRDNNIIITVTVIACALTDWSTKNLKYDSQILEIFTFPSHRLVGVHWKKGFSKIRLLKRREHQDFEIRNRLRPIDYKL